MEAAPRAEDMIVVPRTFMWHEVFILLWINRINWSPDLINEGPRGIAYYLTTGNRK